MKKTVTLAILGATLCVASVLMPASRAIDSLPPIVAAAAPMVPADVDVRPTLPPTSALPASWTAHEATIVARVPSRPKAIQSAPHFCEAPGTSGVSERMLQAGTYGSHVQTWDCAR